VEVDLEVVKHLLCKDAPPLYYHMVTEGEGEEEVVGHLAWLMAMVLVECYVLVESKIQEAGNLA